jgi:hypothetical protein
MSVEGPMPSFEIGYSLVWRVIFLLFGLLLIVISLGSIIVAFTEPDESAVLPISLLILSVLLGLYTLPLVRARPNRLDVTEAGLRLSGDASLIELSWSEIKSVEMARTMPILPAVTIGLHDNARLARFLDDNPRCFLAVTTRFVQVLRRYPWIIRKLFGIPKEATTLAALDWLERRHGGGLTIDAIAARGRAKQIVSVVDARRNSAGAN